MLIFGSTSPSAYLDLARNVSFDLTVLAIVVMDAVTTDTERTGEDKEAAAGAGAGDDEEAAAGAGAGAGDDEEAWV